MENEVKNSHEIAVRNYTKLIQSQTGRAIRPLREGAFNKDGFVNMLNKYGTSKDTSEHYQFEREGDISDDELVAFYEGNGLFAKIIDTPAEEAIKHGFELKDFDDDKTIDFMNEALDELDWEETAMTAAKWTRLFGGAIIVMLVNDGHGLEDPLDWKHIKSIDDLRVYDRSHISVDYQSMYRYENEDPFRTRSSRLGTPERFYVSSKYGNFTVHESRCLIFKNGILPENTTNSQYELWGIPEYLRIKRAIRDAELAHGSSTKMLDKSVQPVYRMKDLARLLSTEEGESTVLRRLQTIDMARGLLNSITIDADGEDYDFRQFQFSGVSDVIDATCNFLSALTSIPQTILFGRSPAGMNATGASDLENYYNYVQRMQKRMLRSNLRYLLSVVFQAGLYTGEIDEMPKINVEFSPLWSLSETEQVALDQQKAQIQLTRAQTASAYVQMQAIDPTEVRKKLADEDEFDVENMLDEYDLEDEDLFPTNVPGQEEEGGNSEEAPMGETPNDGNSPDAAPAATKLPQDMTEEELKKQANADDKNAGSVGVLVIQDGKILCGRRTNDTSRGTICGPGGHIEQGESPEEAAMRETKEEFGIEPIDLIAFGEGPEEPGSGLKPYLFFCTEYNGEVVCDENEMTEPEFREMETLEQLKPSLFQPFRDQIAEFLRFLSYDPLNFDENDDSEHCLYKPNFAWDGKEDGWITINGTHVLVENGNIKTGPDALKIASAKKKVQAIREANKKYPNKIKNYKHLTREGIKNLSPAKLKSGLKKLAMWGYTHGSMSAWNNKAVANGDLERWIDSLMIGASKNSLVKDYFAFQKEYDKSQKNDSVADGVNNPDCAAFDDIEWITVNGTHVPLEEGKAVGGGDLKGKDFSKAKSKKTASTNASKSTTTLRDEMKPTHTGYANGESYEESEEANRGRDNPNFQRLKEIYKTRGREGLRQEFYNFRTERASSDIQEMSLEDAQEELYDTVTPRLAQGWLINADSRYKPAIVDKVLSSPKARSAALNMMYQNYIASGAAGDKPISFQEFLATPIEMFRGGHGQTHTEDDIFSAYSFDRKIAEKFAGTGGKVYSAKIRPIDTWGGLNYNGEAEIMVPSWIAPNGNVDNHDGGPGSGNYGHEGRPGQIGGSSSSGSVTGTEISEVLKDYQIRSLRSPSTSVTGGWGMKASCAEYLRRNGASDESIKRIDSLMDGHKSGGAWQKESDEEISRHLEAKDAVGQALIQRAVFETSCYEEWKKHHPDSRQLDKNGELKVYRKGDRNGNVQSWTINEDGADMGHGGIGVDHYSTLEQLQREGFSVIAGFGTMGGSPGEGEITFARTGNWGRNDGGPGSVNYGHAGVPGQVGGSVPSNSSAPMTAEMKPKDTCRNKDEDDNLKIHARIKKLLTKVRRFNTIKSKMNSHLDVDIPDDQLGFATAENGKVFAYNKETGETSGLGKDVDSETASLSVADKGYLKKYKSSESYIINAKLREPNGYDSLSKEEKELVDGIDAALKKLPHYEGTICRTLHLDPNEDLEKFLGEHRNGDVVKYPAFTSFSKNGLYDDKANVRLYVRKAKRGKDMASVDNGEQEVLYGRNSSFRIVDSVEKDGIHHILMEEC